MISLNYRDSRPIYEQIRDGIKKLIATGAIGPDEKLPSVRVLATQLSINPNPIQRAYAELESEGYTYSSPARAALPPGAGKRIWPAGQIWKSSFPLWPQSFWRWA